VSAGESLAHNNGIQKHKSAAIARHSRFRRLEGDIGCALCMTWSLLEPCYSTWQCPSHCQDNANYILIFELLGPAESLSNPHFQKGCHSALWHPSTNPTLGAALLTQCCHVFLNLSLRPPVPSLSSSPRPILQLKCEKSRHHAIVA